VEFKSSLPGAPSRVDLSSTDRSGTAQDLDGARVDTGAVFAVVTTHRVG
jgi:hypothetical protein